MKIKTALNQSTAGAKFAAVLVLIALCIVIAFPNWTTALFLALSAFILFGDVVNIIHIKRKAAKDPRHLDERIE